MNNKGYNCAIAEEVVNRAVMKVTISGNVTDGYTSDKTNTEIAEAYQSGAFVWAYREIDKQSFVLRNVSSQMANFGDFNPRTGLAIELSVVAGTMVQVTTWKYTGQKQS